MNVRELFHLREAEGEGDPLAEASAPVEMRTAAKALDLSLAGKLPKGLRAHLSTARAELRKRLAVWDSLQGEDDPEVPPPTVPPVAATEAALTGEFSALPLEEATKGPGEFDIRIITPGWGTSGHYPAATLQKAAEAKVFPAGLKMFWDHPSKSQEKERPERSLRDLAGKLKENARWEPNGPEGPGLYARIETFGPYREHVKELAPHIGVSIRADGTGRIGEAEGKTGRIIEAIVGAKSVDFVTAAGAGGKVVELFEAARGSATKEDDNMDLTEAVAAKDAAEAKVKELEEAARARDTETARLREVVLLGEARTAITAKLGAIKLPDATKARLTESVSSRATLKEGKLDAEALATVLDEAVKAEVAYLETIMGKGKVSGMGAPAGDGSGSGSGTGGEAAIAEAEKLLGESVGSGWGLTEAGVKAAIKGRGF